MVDEAAGTQRWGLNRVPIVGLAKYKWENSWWEGGMEEQREEKWKEKARQVERKGGNKITQGSKEG